jgi:hypothetical protein
MSRLAGGKSAANILQYLEGVEFPAKKDVLIHAARRRGAPNDIVGALGQLPVAEFRTPDEVIDAYPKMVD